MVVFMKFVATILIFMALIGPKYSLWYHFVTKPSEEAEKQGLEARAQNVRDEVQDAAKRLAGATKSTGEKIDFSQLPAGRGSATEDAMVKSALERSKVLTEKNSGVASSQDGSRMVSKNLSDGISWPQMLLHSQGEFNRGSSLKGACSFIIATNHGSKWVVTAASLFDDKELANLPFALKSWRAHLPNDEQNHAEVPGGPDLVSAVTNDLVALRLPANAHLPVPPMSIRPNPAAPGEPLFLIGLPEDNSTNVTQRLYEGKVGHTTLQGEGQFVFTLDQRVDPRSFIGAPVIDQRGKVIGVLSGGVPGLLRAVRATPLLEEIGAQ